MTSLIADTMRHLYNAGHDVCEKSWHDVGQVRVKKAAYVKSSVTLAQCPKPKLPEFAVIGRSNVGKSSLINMLTGQDALAKVSKTPGEGLSHGAMCYPIVAVEVMP